jgi:Recombination endonuclease VII
VIDIREKRLSVRYRRARELSKAESRARAAERRKNKTKEQTLKELEDNLSDLLCVACNKNQPTIHKTTATLGYCEDCKQKEDLVQKYGLTLDEYNRIWKEQDGKCAICGLELERVHIDHCHRRDHVRGLLCGHCNTGLGFFRDSTDSLILAAIYLQRNAFSRKWSVALG